MSRYRKLPPGIKVNKARCGTCPFNENGVRELRQRIEGDVLTKASQLCHETNDTTLCRGARDHQLKIFYRMGFLPEPTDAAWSVAMAKLKSLDFPSTK